MKMSICLFLSFLSASVIAGGKPQWTDFCRQERSILAGMPTADKNAIADDVAWLGGGTKVIKIGGQVIDLENLARQFSENGAYSSVVPVEQGDKLHIEVDGENIENIFNFLVETPSEDQLFGYLSKSEIEHLSDKVNKIGTTSAAFSILSSRFGVDSITCLDPNKANDIKKLALLRFKTVPENYELYKRFKGEGIRGLIVGFKLRESQVLEILYEIDQRFIIKMTYVSSLSDLSRNQLYERFLGRKDG